MRQLKHIEENVFSLTQELFTGKEEAMLRKISYVKRDLLDYRNYQPPPRNTSKILKETSIKFWGEA